MSKQRTASSYQTELKKMIKSRTGIDCEPWLMPQIRLTAMNMVMIDKIQAELESTDDLVQLVPGSQGQMKNEVSPLLPHYDKMQRTLMMQLEALGLNYSTTPSKVKEDTRRGASESDRLSTLLTETTAGMNSEIPDMPE